MSLADIQKIGLKQAFLKYKFDLLETRRKEYEEKITHNIAFIALGAGAFLMSIAILLSFLFK